MVTAKQLIAAREEAIARLRAQGESAATDQEISEEMADVLAEWAADAVLVARCMGSRRHATY